MVCCVVDGGVGGETGEVAQGSVADEAVGLA